MLMYVNLNLNLATLSSTEGVASPAPAVVMPAGSRRAQQRLHRGRGRQDRELSGGRGDDAAG